MKPLSILFEDGEALIIDKPAGLPIERPRAGGPCLEDRASELRLGFARSPVPTKTSSSASVAPKATKMMVYGVSTTLRLAATSNITATPDALSSAPL